MRNIELSVFGDNILECERMVELISEAFNDLTIKDNATEVIYAPLKKISNSNLSISIQLYPDYKSHDRWGEKSILAILQEKGAKLSEAPDVILTETTDGTETILLAIEFSSAIPAGNQAWQRSGRALSFSEVFIPYLYITDIGLEELDGDRNSKAVRESNPLVPLSYIKHSQRSETFTYMVLNPSYLLESSEETQAFIVKDEVLHIIRGLVLKEDITPVEKALEDKIANYLSHYENIPESISFEDWIDKSDDEIESFLKSFNLRRYNKKIATKTPIKPEMKLLIKDIVPDHALSIYNNIPICFVPSDKRLDLAKKLQSECYEELNEDVYSWLSTERPLVICFVNGFKPRGDDARPDRGLLPLARMLFGSEIHIMALVFGQAPAAMQQTFAEQPVELASRNGLWKSVLYYSSLTLADSSHWSLSEAEIAQFQLTRTNDGHSVQDTITFPTPDKNPKKFKENDIDTAIHLTFSSHDFIFESLCNPPGGDWSGISFLDKNKVEHRWMSLPRVSDLTKRPDHIFQITDQFNTYVLIIESKEKLSGLLTDKDNLGESLINYVSDLIEYTSSAYKPNGTWEKNESIAFDLDIEKFISAASFFYTKTEEIEQAIKSLKVDFIIAFSLIDHTLHYQAITDLGEWTLKLLREKTVI